MSFVWVIVLLGAVWVAHWGANHLAKQLRRLRQHFGISSEAGGALVGLAAAGPEIGINTASALQGVSDIGLGAMLGSNIFSIPLVITISYLGIRSGKIAKQRNATNPDRILRI